MEITSVKLDDSTIEITKQEPVPAPKVTKYDYSFLVSQRAQIIKQRDEQLSARQKELDEVDGLLAECEKLGVKGKVAVEEPVKEVEPKAE